jgi:stage II sporulation protein AA (anti-sigma F factor antagonist)
MPIKLREKGGIIIADLSGEIRLTVLLNFAKVDFIDSYGIGDVVASYLAVKEKKGRLKLAGLSPKIWLIFQYSGLTRILEIFDSEEKALRSFV